MLPLVPQLISALAPVLYSALVSAAATPLPPVVTWEQVASAPYDHVQDESRMVLQFHSIEKDWEPYCTPLSPRTHLAVRAWSDAQLPWIEEQYRSPRARYFVRRGGLAEQLFKNSVPHDRIVVTGRVRAWFLGQPWIEVVAARRAQEQVPLGTVLHAISAISLLRREAPHMAIDQLGRALAAPLPRHAREALEALLPPEPAESEPVQPE